MNLRITGLVKFFNHVRAQLQSSIPRPELESFKKQVLDITQHVEAICKQYGGTPDMLPAPSRNAYLFLKNLDLDNLPIGETGASTSPKKQIHLKNVVSIGDYFAAKCWQNIDTLLDQVKERQKLLQDITPEVGELDRVCRNHGASPANLAAPSRRVYCWLKFLSIEDNLKAHLESLQIVRRLARQLPAPYNNVAIEIWMLNMQALYRVRTSRNHILVKCSEGFLNAGEAVWKDMLEGIFLKKGNRRQGAMAEYITSEDFSGVLFEMESFAEDDVDSAKGHAHDLDASFARVNKRYFNGAMPKPLLKWNRLLTVAKMGHYHSLRDTVMLSLSLDHPEVPQFVIDYVMYHELLHKKHGETVVNGRRFVHHSEFRREEKKFEQYSAAIDFLNQLSRKQRGMPESGAKHAAPKHIKTKKSGKGKRKKKWSFGKKSKEKRR